MFFIQIPLTKTLNIPMSFCIIAYTCLMYSRNCLLHIHVLRNIMTVLIVNYNLEFVRKIIRQIS